MTDNETIALALGWKNIIDNDVYDIDVWWRNDDGVEQQFGCPQYDADLNLIHEAEAMLTDEERYRYLAELGSIVYDYRKDYNSLNYGWAVIHATAAQCARALAKVLGGRTHG